MDTFRRLLQAQSSRPHQIRTLCIEAEEAPWEGRPEHTVVANDIGTHLLPYARNLRDVRFDIHYWSDADDPLVQLLLQAGRLRTLCIIQEPTTEDWETGLPIPFAAMPSLLPRCLAIKDHLKHLFLSKVELADNFGTSPVALSPFLQFRLTHLTLTDCIISDSVFKSLMTSQAGW